jgi:hypothetical protein
VDSVSVNVGAKLATTLQRIQQANPTTLAGVFGDVNWAIRTGCPKRSPATQIGNRRNCRVELDGQVVDDHVVLVDRHRPYRSVRGRARVTWKTYAQRPHSVTATSEGQRWTLSTS